jgi:predicted NBD/HSP70 family sugar kinase
MNLYSIEVDVINKPVLDETFIPVAKFNTAFLKTAKKPVCVAVERNDSLTAVFDTFIHGTDEMFAADCYYIGRVVKLLLWTKGGFKVFVCGDEKIAQYIKNAYTKDGIRAFDLGFMSQVYESEFEVISLPYNRKPAEKDQSKPLGRHLDGCRIGFDAGGSDRKVSAVINGETVFSEEVVWYPKNNADHDYHFTEIVGAFKAAAAKMPRVDAIGVSSAGVYINNKTMVASLFLKVPRDDFEKYVKNIYIRAVKEIGDNIPFEVANDGDVTALAGAMDLNETRILGIAMGTSEAGGYVDKDGNITGWLNELAFVPVDAQQCAMCDEWSGDIGCGVKYFSQDAVIKLAPSAGIMLDEALSPAEKLAAVQKLVAAGDEQAMKIFETIGSYLGHAVSLYAEIYDMGHILLMGRVMSGKGGHKIIETASHVLETEYPELFKTVTLHLPDESSRRVGQSVAAASLPALK